MVRVPTTALPPPRLPIGRTGSHQRRPSPDDPTEQKWIRLGFGNITRWGPLAEGFVAGAVAKSCHVLGFSEHHLPQAQAKTMVRALGEVNRRALFAPAKTSLRSETGTCGGVVLAPWRHLQLAAQHGSWCHKGTDWVSIILRLRGIDLTIVQLYLLTGVGPRGDNILRLADIARHVLSKRQPFLMFGDFNMTPAELQQLDILLKLKACIIVAAHGEATCSSGRCLDFVVASSCIAPALRSVSFASAPWKTHAFLTFEVMRAPRQVHARFLVRPRRFVSDERAEHADRMQAFVDPASQYDSLPPVDAMRRHMESEIGAVPAYMGSSLLGPFTDDCLDASTRYAAWSRRLEVALGDQFQCYGRQYLGRGCFPRFVLRATARPAGEPDRAKAPHSLWARVESALLVLTQHLRRQGLSQRSHQACGFLEGEALSLLQERLRGDFQGAGISPSERLHLQLWCARLRGIRALPEDIVRGLFVDAGVRAKADVAAALAKTRKSITTWAQKAVSGAASLGHKYLKAPDPAENSDITEDLMQAGAVLTQPDQILSSKEAFWSGQWNFADADRGVALREQLVTLRPAACEARRTAGCIEAGQVRRAIRSLATSRGLGLDFTSPLELRAMPPQLIDELAALLNQCEVSMTPPLQAMVNLMSLIPKPSGGDRAICLGTMFYVIWASIRAPQTHIWEQGYIKFWDDAVKGSCALRAALLRRLFDEVQHLEGRFAVTAFWDIEKFFDSVTIERLIRNAVEANYPLHIFFFDLLFHVGPRFLRWSGWLSHVILVQKSILAGARKSCAFARLIMYPIIEAWHYTVPDVIEGSLRSFVDDLAQSVVAEREEGFVQHAAALMRGLADGLVSAELRISTKSRFTASHPRLAHELQQAMVRHEVPIRAATVVKDLGIDATQGKRRSTATLRGRAAKAKRKTIKAVKLGRMATGLKHRVARFWLSNTQPTASYGASAFGLSEAALREQRTMCSRTAQTKFGQCPLSVIAIAHGIAKDPEVQVLKLSIGFWISVWSSADATLRARLEVAWRTQLRRLFLERKASEHTWNKVTGPISALQASLHRIRWKCPRPDMWISTDRHGELWHTIAGTGNTTAVLKHVAESVLRSNAPKLTTHWSGSGAQEVPFFQEVARHRNKLLHQERFEDAGRLLCISTGATWPNARRLSHGMPQHYGGKCMRCGGVEDETDLHRYWRCPDNLQAGAAVAATTHLERFAIEDAGQHDILWMRGIPTQDMLRVPEPRDDFLVEETGELVLAAKITLYSDGTGGKHSSCPVRRRCGWAWVQMQGGLQLSFARFSPLCGAPQTVPRSELSAVIDILFFVPPDVELLIVVDAKYVSNIASSILRHGRSADQHRALWSDNGDLWSEFVRALRARTAPTEIVWSKSHATALMLWSGFVARQHFVGNAFADSFADLGADRCQLSDAVLMGIDFVLGRAHNIRKRLIAVLHRIQEFEKKELAELGDHLAPLPPPSIDIPRGPRGRKRKISVEQFLHGMSQLGHQLELVPTKLNSSFQCKLRRVRSRQQQYAQRLQEGPCKPIAPSPIHSTRIDRAGVKRSAATEAAPSSQGGQGPPSRARTSPQPAASVPQQRANNGLLSEPPIVGSTRIHASHHLDHQRGIIMCLLCGHHAIRKCGQLNKPCKHPPSRHYREILSRWRRGLPPDARTGWPGATSDIPDGEIWRPRL